MNEGERQLLQLLRGRYPADRWALFPQVADSTGWASSYADAIAVSLWPSLGVQVHGFEFKASRGDWKRELRLDGKAEVVGRYCNFWWLVTPHLDIVKDKELPADWGWLSAQHPPRLSKQQLDVEEGAWRDQLTFGFQAEEVDAPLPPPRPVLEEIPMLTLWTVQRAPKREAIPPDWSFLASVLRRAQTHMAATHQEQVG